MMVAIDLAVDRGDAGGVDGDGDSGIVVDGDGHIVNRLVLTVEVGIVDDGFFLKFIKGGWC